MATPITIFRAGTHTDSSGVTRSFSVADLDAMAAGYDPALHEAPVVVGHPQDNTPAYGWVERLERAGDTLRAHLKQVDPQFAELVNQGRYKKISASFYPPDSSSNPRQGAFYLRHVGFLGAQPPAVKGLGDARFREGEEGVIEFNASFTKETTTMEQSEKEKQLAEREQKVAQAEAALRALENGAFAEGLVREGKLLPVHKGRVVSMLNGLRGDEVLEFSEGDQNIRATPAQALRGLLSALPIRVDFSERAGPEDAPREVSYSVQPGYTVDPERMDLHRKAVAYMQQHKTDYFTAVMTLSR